jgi:hypothetical protein
MELRSFGMLDTIWPIYCISQLWTSDDDERGAIGRMRIGKGNQIT